MAVGTDESSFLAALAEIVDSSIQEFGKNFWIDGNQVDDAASDTTVAANGTNGDTNGRVSSTDFKHASIT
jgi:hypothetical protein